MGDALAIEDQIIAALRRIIRAVDLHSRWLVERYGLTWPQLAVLREAERLKAVPAGELARAANLSQATVTGILDRLERRELITRARSGQDRRSVIVTITEAGDAVLRTEPSLLQDRFRRRLIELEEWERTMILGTLQRMAQMMEAEDIEAAPVLVTGVAITGETPVTDVDKLPAETPEKGTAKHEEE